MCYLKRKIDSFLTEWKAAPRHKPLIVKGPRQVGKTESVRRFAESSYENVIYINFEIGRASCRERVSAVV